MKKQILIFIIGYSVFLGLGMACLWELFGFALAVALDGMREIDKYPYYFLFCIICAFIAMCACLMVFVFNMRFSQKVVWSKRIWTAEFLCAFVIAIPITKCWLDLFWILQCKF